MMEKTVARGLQEDINIANVYNTYRKKLSLTFGGELRTLDIRGDEILEKYRQQNYLTDYPYLQEYLRDHIRYNSAKDDWIPPDLMLRKKEGYGYEPDLLAFKRREPLDYISQLNGLRNAGNLNILYPLKVPLFHQLSTLLNEPLYDVRLFIHTLPIRFFHLTHVKRDTTSPYLYFVISPEIVERRQETVINERVNTLQHYISLHIDAFSRAVDNVAEKIGPQVEDNVNVGELARLIVVNDLIQQASRKGGADTYSNIEVDIEELSKVRLSSPSEVKATLYSFYLQTMGYDKIEPLMLDPLIEDISCNGLNQPIFVYHTLFKEEETTIRFKSRTRLQNFLRDLGEVIGQPVSTGNPIADGSASQGERVNMVFGEEISKKGSNFTIRKKVEPFSITQLIALGTINAEIAAYLWLALNYDLNIFFVGPTASGKTTTLNASAGLIPPNYKVLTIEETAEVVIPHENWLQELTREGRYEQTDIEMYELVKTGLRQRPNYVIVGEIRGEEGSAAFQAMQTGHPVLSTFHADSVKRLVQRLSGSPINVPKTFVPNLDLVFIQQRLLLPGYGDYVRRCSRISEILGYEKDTDSHLYQPVFEYYPTDDTHDFIGRGTSTLISQKLAPRMGVPEGETRKVYEELDKRAEILQDLTEMELFNYFDFWKVASQYTANWQYMSVKDVLSLAEDVMSS